MAEVTGVSSHCQGCGICTTKDLSLDYTNPNEFVDKIVDEVVRTLKTGESGAPSYPKIPLGVSNRHIHLTKETFAKLFGAEAAFEPLRDLYQPGEFASKHTLVVVGPKMKPITGVRILGPFRKYDQVEVALTDAIQLGIKPPVKDSGDLSGAAPVTLVGPKGSVFLPNAAIIANRHLHMTNEHARQFGVNAGDWVKVRIGGTKGVIYENVLVRINDAWKLQLHLDTDDANAAGVVCDTKVEFAGMM